MFPGEPMPMPATLDPASFSAAAICVADRVDDRLECKIFEVLLVLGMNRPVVGDDRRGHVRSAEVYANCRTHGAFMFGAATGRTRTAEETNGAWRPSTSSTYGAIRVARGSRRTPNCSTRVRSNTSIKSRSTKNTSPIEFDEKTTRYLQRERNHQARVGV